ncbi:unnamed protein product [Peniophora sp. CBMAI 1063]|nr:unnamed protein product [Peniophora sp. CBMAI 1063]
MTTSESPFSARAAEIYERILSDAAENVKASHETVQRALQADHMDLDEIVKALGALKSAVNEERQAQSRQIVEMWDKFLPAVQARKDAVQSFPEGVELAQLNATLAEFEQQLTAKLPEATTPGQAGGS